MSLHTKSTVYVTCFLLSTFFLPATALPWPESRELKEDSLVLSLTAPPSVNDVKDIIITGTLENTSTEDMLVVKDPSGILYDFFAADALEFKRTDSKAKNTTKSPTFVGYMAKWDMKTYLQNNNEEDDYLPDDHKDVVSLTADSKSRMRRGSEDSSEESGSLSDTESSVSGSSESGDKKYPLGTTLDLPAGKTIKFNYKVGEAYDFSKSGAGTYTFKLKRGFLYVLVDNDMTYLEVKVDANTIKINGNLKTRIPEPEKLTPDAKITENDTIDGRDIIQRSRKARETKVTTQGCGKVQISIIDIAAQHADRYVSEANEYISAMTGPTTRYEHWFGYWNTEKRYPYNWKPMDQVTAMFKSLFGRSFWEPGTAGPGYAYDCTCEQNIYAYIKRRLDLPAPAVGLIYLCKGFRAKSTPMVGYDSKAGILVHEATHFTFHPRWAEDQVEDHEPSHQLAVDNPFLASINSDNYEYFVENEPPLD